MSIFLKSELKGGEERVYFVFWEKLIECIIELVDDLRPNFYVHRNEVVQKMNGVHRK